MTIYTVTTTNDELDDLDGSGSVSVENFGGAGDISLREAIALANADSDADTIRFAGGAGEAFENAALLRLTQGELLITADLTIDGSSAGGEVVITSDANGDDILLAGSSITDVQNNTNTSDNSRIIKIEKGTTSLEGLTFTGGYSTGRNHGGAIYAGGYYNPVVNVSNSLVSGNKAEQFGGGIYAEKGTLTNVVVSNNQASLGGGVNLIIGTLIDSAVLNNHAEAGGGISGEELILINTVVSGNTSDFGGGGVRGEDVTITNSTIASNTARLGGGIDAGSAIIIGTKISDNIATQSGGGGIFASESVSVVDSEITDNKSEYSGGGISSRLVTVLTNSIVSGSAAAERGGGVYTQSTAILENSVVSDNYARTTGGGIDSPDTVLMGSTVSNNRVYIGGGGIYSSSQVTLKNSIVIDNYAGTYGGGILSSDSTVIGSTISGNEARYGGGITADQTTLINTTIAGNSAERFGGGLYIDGTATITNSTISGNKAVEDGGGIATLGETTLVNSIVLGNSVASMGQDEIATLARGSRGPGLVVDGGGTSIVGTNTNSFDTSAFDSIINADPALVFAATQTIDPDNMANNGDEFVSGVLADNGGPVETIALLADVLNPALDVGQAPIGVFVDATRRMRVTDIENIDNGGGVDAGAVELSAFAFDNAPAEARSLIVTTTQDITDAFDGETSLREAIAFANDEAAGALMAGDADPHDTITFAASVGEAFENDALIRLVLGELLITSEVTIDGLSAGGDVVITGDAAGDDVLLAGTNFTDTKNNTHTSDNSRVINITADHSTLSGLTITGGFAFAFGGGVLGSNATLKIITSQIVGNTSESPGGGVHAGDATLIGSTVSGNIAQSSGGGINAIGDITLINSTVSHNTAERNSFFSLSFGGGISSFSATTINSTITGNRSNLGKGINVTDDLVVTNSIITGNASGRSAPFGEIRTNSSSGNFSISNGGGTSIVGASPDVFDASMIDGIINAEPTLVFAVTQTFDPDGVANNGNEFVAGVLDDNGGPVQTIALLSNVLNPALDVGEEPAGPTFDADGNPRTFDQIDVDNGGTVDAGAVELQVPASRPPVAENDNFSLMEAERFILDGSVLIANGGAADSDIDLDVLTIVAVNGQAIPASGMITLPSLAVVTVNADGTFSYDATNAFDFLEDGQVQTDSFSYTITDGNGGFSTATVTIDLTGSSVRDDILIGSGPNETLNGGAGNDILVSLGGNDLLSGGSGDDFLAAGNGFDTLFGGLRNDTLSGGSRADNLFGGVGNDDLNGDGGNDRVFGEMGDDIIRGGAGDDRLFGGAGFDTVIGGTGNDLVSDNFNIDVLFGGAGFDTLEGGAGNDTLNGDAQADNLFGEDGDDMLDGGHGADRLFGGVGNDVLLGATEDDALFGQLGADRLDGGDGNDRLFGNAGADTLNGGAGDDTLSGNFNADIFVFKGDFGNDVITDFDASNRFERIDLSGLDDVSTFTDLMITDDGLGNALFTIGTNTITLTGVDRADLTAADFIF